MVVGLPLHRFDLAAFPGVYGADFTAVAADEKRKIVRQNAIDLYDLGLE